MTNEFSVNGAGTGVATVDALQALMAAPSKYATADAEKELIGSGYLPYLAIHGSSSKIVKSKETKFPMGHFGLTEGKNTTDLGEEVVIVVLGWRPKAMQFSPEVLSFYDQASAEFQDVRDRAGQKDSGCSYGPEFLLWLPDYKKFCAYFMGSKSARNESQNVMALLKPGKDGSPPKMVGRLVSDEAENKKGQTWSIAVTKDHDLDYAMPPMQELVDVKTKFDNPAVKTKELVEPEAEGSDRD